MEGVWRVWSVCGGCVEGVEGVWRVCGGCVEGVEGVWRVCDGKRASYTHPPFYLQP